MRPLMIDDKVKAAVENVVAWATRPDHYYEVDKQPRPAPPGDDPHHIVHIPHGFRVVFSITRADGKLYRHLSISIPTEKWPHPLACCSIAELFGFSGFCLKDCENGYNAGSRRDPIPDGWLIAQNHEDHCITIAEELPPVN